MAVAESVVACPEQMAKVPLMLTVGVVVTVTVLIVGAELQIPVVPVTV